jgi:hypothetical protein
MSRREAIPDDLMIRGVPANVSDAIDADHGQESFAHIGETPNKGGTK